MDDLFKNLAIGFFAFLVIHGSLEQRSRHGAARQVKESFQNTGSVRARVTPRGMFGLYANDIYAVDLYAKGIETDRLPFSVVPRRGWKGRIKYLRLHFINFTLMGLPIERFEAEIPDATFDLGHAYQREKLVLRSAGTGPSSVKIGPAGLEAFLTRKYNQILSDVKVSFNNQKLNLTGRVNFLGLVSPLAATGRLVPRAGRYVDLADPKFVINDKEVNSVTANLLVQRFNPILDIETDLGLRGFFTITEVEIGDAAVLLRGRITVPHAENSPASPEKKETQSNGNGSQKNAPL